MFVTYYYAAAQNNNVQPNYFLRVTFTYLLYGTHGSRSGRSLTLGLTLGAIVGRAETHKSNYITRVR